jgi:hypothetical protein
VTCVHVGVLPPTHNWAKILENCQAKKRPRLIHFLFEILRSWDVARLDGVDGAEEDEDHIVDQGHQDREG